MKVGIVGGGVVGRATARAWLEHCEEVRVHDIVMERSSHSIDEVMRCNLVFVCLPTPQRLGSLECDTSVLEQFFEGCNSHAFIGRRVNLILRSTVPIGFTRQMRERYQLANIVHSPEFLTSRCATVDAQIPTRNIIGSPRGVWSECSRVLSDAYENRWAYVPVLDMTSDESEAVKLFQNGFFAVKVAYWNECRALADKLDLDWEDVMYGILTDGRIHPSHTQVPGPDGKLGFGGSCLPKDLANLIDCYHHHLGATHEVLSAAAMRNERDRGTDP